MQDKARLQKNTLDYKKGTVHCSHHILSMLDQFSGEDGSIGGISHAASRILKPF